MSEIKVELIPKNEVEEIYKELLWIVQYHLEDMDIKLCHEIMELFHKEYDKLNVETVTFDI